MHRKLTALMIDKIRPDPDKRLEIPDGGRPGLYLFVQPSGHKSFVVKYRLGGKQRKFVIGFPSLAVARMQATDALDLIADGKDPVLAARAAEGDLFSSVAEEFIERHVKAKTRQVGTTSTERLLRVEVIPIWGTRPIQSITRRNIIELVDAIADRGAPVEANRTLTAIKTLFAWALSRDILAASPAIAVKRPTIERVRERVLTDAEIASFWKACGTVGYPFGDACKILLLLGQRRVEVFSMSWSEIDLGARVWNLPANRTKNARQHAVPLPDMAIEILKARPHIGPNNYVFANSAGGPYTAYSRGKAELDGAMVPAPDSGWTLHDLRRTAATGMHEIGVAPHVVEAVLNHQSGHRAGIAGVYNHAGYANEKRAALGAWAETVRAIVEGKERPSVKRRLVTLWSSSMGLGKDE
jgi:integrase